MIKIIRNILSWFFYFSGINNLLYKIGNRKIFFLVYHRVLDMEPEFSFNRELISSSVFNFKRQMEFLSKKYNVISLKTFFENINNKTDLLKNSVVLTFDDGYLDNYLNAYPILKQYKFPAVFFLAGDAIDKDKLFWWDELAYIINKTGINYFKIKGLGKFFIRNEKEKLKAINKISLKLKKIDEIKIDLLINTLIDLLEVKPPEIGQNNRLTLHWNEIKEMSQNGILFGSHTMSHVILTNISLSDAAGEIEESKNILNKNIVQEINCFSYPNGYRSDFNNEIKEIIKKNKFKCALTYIPGWNDSKSDLFELCRNSVDFDTDMILFKNKLVGFDIFPKRMVLFFQHLTRSRKFKI